MTSAYCNACYAHTCIDNCTEHSPQDYVLEQILLGRDNTFARAVAQGTLEANAPMLRAVAYDLDVLQVRHVL